MSQFSLYLKSLGQCELYHLILPQRLECWPESKKFNLRMKKEDLIAELINPANGFKINRLPPDLPLQPAVHLAAPPLVSLPPALGAAHLLKGVMILLEDLRTTPAQLSTQLLELDVVGTYSGSANEYNVNMMQVYQRLMDSPSRLTGEGCVRIGAVSATHPPHMEWFLHGKLEVLQYLDPYPQQLKVQGNALKLQVALEQPFRRHSSSLISPSLTSTPVKQGRRSTASSPYSSMPKYNDDSSRDEDADFPSSQASWFDGTNSQSDREQVSLRQNSIPDVSIGRSSTSTTRTSLESSSRVALPLSSATVPNTPQPPPQSPSHVTRQSSLRSKLSLPNLCRKQSKQPDDTVSIAASSIDASSSINGEPEFEMAQVGGMEFKLVRPSFSHFRNSEDSFAGRDRDGMSVDGGAGGGGLLRADSPAMSYTSSGQHSPSVGDFRLPHTPPPPPSSQLPASTMTPSKLSSAPQTFESASTIESHRQRELKWLTLISAVPSSQARKNKKVKRLLMEGEVPSSARGAYERIVEGGKGWIGGKNGEVEEIEKDVRESGVEVSTQESMVMVMQMSSTVVVSLTHIARNLLSHAPEQDGFWVFVSLMDSYLRPYFSAMTTTQKEVDAMLFAEALENNDPTVAKKVFTAMGVNVLTICDYWFSSVFVNSFPSAYLQRIWDVFLFEGIPFLLRIGLAIFTLTCRQILELPGNPSTLTPTPSAD
ncbi:hypothetical protein ONZ45_g9887 [Pleurotus djamor]|nr:hypothetical protein ONZ45_g9887 [Pleurotus djamor]